MFAWRAVTLVALVLVAGAQAFASTPSVIEDMLQEADSIRSSDPQRFIAILGEIDRMRSETDEFQLQHLEYLQIYKAVTYDHKYGEAILRGKELYARTSSTDLKFRVGSLILNTYAYTRQFQDGIRYIDSILPLREKVKDKDIRENGGIVVAIFYNKLGQYRLGLQYANEVLDDAPSARAQCFANYSRLDALYNLGQLSGDGAEIASVIRQCEAIDERIVSDTVRVILARKLVVEGKRRQAIAMIKRYMAEAEATGYEILIDEMHASLASFMLLNSESGDAREQAKMVVDRHPQMISSPSLVSAYKTLYQVDEARGDLKSAIVNFRMYAEAEKIILNDRLEKELAFHLVRQETAQKNQQIELLNKKNQVLQLQQRVNEQQAQFSRLLIAMLIMLLGLIGYWAYKVKRAHVSLRHMAEVDALTGVCNRHRFSQLAEQLLEQSARAGEDVALVMFDLDHFKSINDRFGHDTGDWVLQRVADTCKGFCRRIDYLGRLGGEEFAILLAGCDLRAATRVAEDCRVRLASIDTQPSGHKFVITASFGITASSLSSYGLAKMLSHADQALYRAKRAGRNRVCAYDGEPPQWTQAHVVAIEGHAVPATSAGQDSAT